MWILRWRCWSIGFRRMGEPSSFISLPLSCAIDGIIVTDGAPSCRPTRMTGDALYLSSAPASSPPSSEVTKPNAELLARLAFSAGMARVTKLGVYEEQFDEFAEGIRSIPKLLESVSSALFETRDMELMRGDGRDLRYR